MAVVPMSELFAPDGYLAALRAEGYEIEEPELAAAAPAGHYIVCVALSPASAPAR